MTTKVKITAELCQPERSVVVNVLGGGAVIRTRMIEKDGDVVEEYVYDGQELHVTEITKATPEG